MKLPAPLVPGGDTVLQLFGLFSLAVIFAAVAGGREYLFAVPPALLAASTLWIFPNAILWLFLASFFWGRFIVDRHFIGVTITDAVFLLFLLAYAAPLMYAKRQAPRARSHRRIMRALVLLLAWSLFSFLVNLRRYDAVEAAVSLWWLFKCAQVVVFFRVSADAFRDIDTKKVISIVLFFSALQAPVVAWQLMQTRGMEFIEGRGYVLGTFTYHHSMLGTMMLVAVALALHRFLAAQRLPNKAAYAAVCVLYFVILVVSGTRSALVGAAVAVVVWTILGFRSWPKPAMLLALMTAVYGAKIFLSPAVRTHFTPYIIDQSTLSRLLIWEGAIQHFASMNLWEKLVGVGIGAYFTVPYKFVLWGGLRHITGAHNNLLHVLLETGVGGLGIFIYLLFEILRQLYRLSRRSTVSLVTFYLTIALIASGATQETLWFQKAFGSFFLFYIVIVAIAVHHQPSHDRHAAEA